MDSEKRELVVIPGISVATIPKSKIKVFNALRSLAEEKPFDKISVREICEHANVSKSTFYANFSDKYAIIQWHYDMVMEAGVDRIGRTLSWEEGHLITTFGFAPVHPLYMHASKSVDAEGILPYGLQKREAVIFETLTDYRHIELTDKLRFQTTALAAAEQAVVRKYLHNSSPFDIYSYVENMLDIVPRALYEALQIDSNETSFILRNPWEDLLS